MSGEFFAAGGPGFFTISSLLSPSEVDGLAQLVNAYIVAKGPLLRPYGLGDQGGWYVADFVSDARLAPIYHALHGRARLHAALRDTFGGRGARYKILSRNDIYTDRHSEWHMDKLHGPFSWYIGGASSVRADAP